MRELAVQDDIDLLIDGLLADPSRAPEVKERLRRRFQGRPPAPVRHLRVETSDPDDLWDNVPI